MADSPGHAGLQPWRATRARMQWELGSKAKAHGLQKTQSCSSYSRAIHTCDLGSGRILFG